MPALMQKKEKSLPEKSLSLKSSLINTNHEFQEQDQPDQIVHILLNKDMEQEAKETDSCVKLDYRKIDERFSLNKQSKEIEAYLHNEGTRLTFVRVGMCAYTF